MKVLTNALVLLAAITSVSAAPAPGPVPDGNIRTIDEGGFTYTGDNNPDAMDGARLIILASQENANALMTTAATLAREAVCSVSLAPDLVNAGQINWLNGG